MVFVGRLARLPSSVSNNGPGSRSTREGLPGRPSLRRSDRLRSPHQATVGTNLSYNGGLTCQGEGLCEMGVCLPQMGESTNFIDLCYESLMLLLEICDISVAGVIAVYEH